MPLLSTTSSYTNVILSKRKKTMLCKSIESGSTTYAQSVKKNSLFFKDKYFSICAFGNGLTRNE